MLKKETVKEVSVTLILCNCVSYWTQRFCPHLMDTNLCLEVAQLVLLWVLEDCMSLILTSPEVARCFISTLHLYRSPSYLSLSSETPPAPRFVQSRLSLHQELIFTPGFSPTGGDHWINPDMLSSSPSQQSHSCLVVPCDT